MSSVAGYRHNQKQEQRISSSLIQGLNMLSLPAAAMYDYLVELSMANPMLEIPEPPANDIFENISGGEQSFTRIERGKDPGYYDTPVNDGIVPDDEDFDPYYSRGVAFEADALYGSLKLQLSMCRLSPAEELIGLEIIGDLDDSGYFVGNIETICLLYRQDIEVGRRVLRLIQGFQPKGIAAKDVYEALCLQVEDDFPYADLARRLIREDLSAVCDSTPADCASQYGVSAQCMSLVFDYIRALEPRPGNCDERPIQINYILPDIVVKKSGDELQLFISGDGDNPLRINEYYLELLDHENLSYDEKQYLRSSLNTARSLIHSVDVRRQTMHRAALSLLALQRDFFRYGPDKMRPLTMQQLAEEMGVHVSTVSRIVQDKYISTPYGLYPLKAFFVRAIKGTDNSTMSSDGAKRRIDELIRAEDCFEPMTDDDICAALSREGYCLSRRTVSKYRQEAGIPGYIKRRRKRG